MKVYDCCPFWIENDLFEIRLNQHWNFVDKFIVVEAGETHTGIAKPFNFDHARFAPYSSKIVYAKFDSFEQEMANHPELIDENTFSDRGSNKTSIDWARDSFQTNYTVKVLRDIGAEPNDIAYISCCDEILNESAFTVSTPVLESENNAVLMFRYWLYAYKFNLLSKHWKDADTSGLMSTFAVFDKKLPGTIREHRMCTHIVDDAGWHFTYMDNSGGEQVLAKHRSWAHSRDVIAGEKRKFDYDENSLHEAVSHVIESYKVQKVDLSPTTHPTYLLQNLNKFTDYIL